MGQFALRTSERIQEFGQLYIPKGLTWHENNPRESPYDGPIRSGTYPIRISFFTQVGLRLPLDTLIVQFPKAIRLHLGQVTLNVIRIILGVAKLNRRFNMSLGLYEIMYFYFLNCSRGKWNLKARVNSPSLIEGLPSSHKSMYDDIILINGSV